MTSPAGAESTLRSHVARLRQRDLQRQDSTVPTIFQAVVEQVLQYLRHLVSVASNTRQVGVNPHCQLNVTLGQPGLESRHHPTHEPLQVERCGRRLMFGQFNPRQA